MSKLRDFWVNVVGVDEPKMLSPNGPTTARGPAAVQDPGRAVFGADAKTAAPVVQRDALGAAPTPTGAGNKPAPTDDSKLRAVGTASVSKDGENADWGDIQPDIQYVFFTDVVNTGNLPSGPFFVKFTLTGEFGTEDWQDWEDVFTQDDGLKPGAKVRAKVDFGKFPNKSANYRLTACVYSNSAPDDKISCAGEYGLHVYAN